MAKIPWIDLPGEPPSVDIGEIKVEASTEGDEPAVHCVMECEFDGQPCVVVINMNPLTASELGQDLISTAVNISAV